MSADSLLQLCGSLAGGLKYTVSLFFITVLVSIPIGLLLSFTRVGRSRVLKGLVGAYVWVMRGTPLLLQLYFFCYGITFLPGIGDYLVMDRFQAAILAFMPPISAKFSAAASCLWTRGSMRRPRCWAIPNGRPPPRS